MKKKISVRNKRGAISLFVLLSLLFFLVLVTGVATSFKNKETTVNSQIAKVKASYEKDLGNEEQVYAKKIKEKENELYKELIIDPNGGTWGTNLTAKTTIKKEVGSTFDVAAPTPPTVVLNLDGGTLENEIETISFVKWQLNGSGSLNGNTYTFGEGNGTLTATYSKSSIALPNVTKSGYNFNGWYDDKNNKVENTESYKPVGTVNLTAHWTEKATKNIILAFIDASGEEKHGTPNPLVLEEGQTSGTVTTPEIADYTGYTTKYWVKGETPDLPQVATSGGTLDNVSENGTYYAVYQKQVEVNFNLDGATGTSPETLTGSIKVNVKVNSSNLSNISGTSITLPTEVPTKQGYEFSGWKSSEDNKIYNAGATYTSKAGATMTAQWTTNELTFEDQTITKIYSTEAQEANVTSATNGTGTYTYSKKSGESGITVSNAGVITISANKESGTYTIVITATDSNSGATKDATYTITIENAEIIGSVTISGTNKVGETLTASPSTTVPSSGATFSNYQWYSNNTNSTSEGEEIIGATGSTYIIDSSMKGKYIYVKVKASANNYNDKTLTSAVTQQIYITITYTKGTGVSEIGKTSENVTGSTTLPTITASSGYKADGWYDGNTKAGNAGASYTPTNNVTLTAKATINSYTITLKAGTGISTISLEGWTNTETATITKNLEYGSTVDLSKVIVTNATGYSGSSWTKTSGGGTLNGTTFIVGEGVTTLTVTGTAETYTITYNLDGGTNNNLNPSTYTIETNDITLASPTKIGYGFIGWTGNGTTEPTKNLKLVRGSTGNKEYTAHWTDAVARIGEQYYSTLQAALDAVPKNNEETIVTLLQNTSGQFTVLEKQNVKFSLGDLTISNIKEKSIIENNGKISISDGTISTNTTQGAINNNSGGEIVMTGGEIIATNNKQAIWNNGGTVTISGSAHLKAQAKVENSNKRATVHNNTSSSTLIITGGIIETTSATGIAVTNAGIMRIGIEGEGLDQATPVIQGGVNGVYSTTNFEFYDGIIKARTPNNTISDRNKISRKEQGYELIDGEETIGGVNYRTVFLGEGRTVTFNANEGIVSETQRYIEKGKKVGKLPEPTRSGYIFKGWFTSAEGGDEVTENTIITDDITFYAHWNRLFIVTFDANEGTLDENTREVENGNEVGKLPQTTREGYVFKGWFTQSEGGDEVTKNIIITEDVTFYAHWEPLFTVTFDPAGGTVEETTKEVENGKKIKKLPEPTRTGYVSKGWYTQSEGGDKITEDTIITSDITFYAHWAKAITITFNANEGNILNGTKNVEEGQPIGEMPTATRKGYEFVGWYTQSEGGDKITETTIVGNQNVTYYAHWNKIQPAAIDGTLYGTLQEAIDKVSTNGTQVTIDILQDTTESVKTKAGQNIIFNLQNNTISNDGSNKIIDNYGTITFTNGTIASEVKTASTIDNFPTGTIIIDGVDIITTGERQAIYNKGGIVEIRGNSLISAESTGNAPKEASEQPRSTIQNFAGGTLKITGGTIISNTQSAIANAKDSTVTIGKKDGSVNISSPIVAGETYGIINKGTLNFYDGTIKGKQGAVDGQITDKEENTREVEGIETIDEDTIYQTLYLEVNTPESNNATSNNLSIQARVSNTLGKIVATKKSKVFTSIIIMVIISITILLFHKKKKK